MIVMLVQYYNDASAPAIQRVHNNFINKNSYKKQLNTDKTNASAGHSRNLVVRVVASILVV